MSLGVGFKTQWNASLIGEIKKKNISMVEEMIAAIIDAGMHKKNDYDQNFQELRDTVKRQEVKFQRIKEGLDKVQSHR